jgi:hypothetical protein
MLLYEAAAEDILPVMSNTLAQGADKLWWGEEGKSHIPLHLATISLSVMAVEFLNLNNADNDTEDDDGKTPLHLGTELGNLAQVNLLLKHSAHHHIQES